eukprot:XP_001708225.1 Hypothetical protein GL50803_33118 [Giardia lamblia ATCC 50803]
MKAFSVKSYPQVLLVLQDASKNGKDGWPGDHHSETVLSSNVRLAIYDLDSFCLC